MKYGHQIAFEDITDGDEIICVFQSNPDEVYRGIVVWSETWNSWKVHCPDTEQSYSIYCVDKFWLVTNYPSKF